MSILTPAARILHFALKARNIQCWTDYSLETHFISSSTSSLTLVTPCTFSFLSTVSDLLSSWKMLPGQPSWHHLVLLLRTNCETSSFIPSWFFCLAVTPDVLLLVCFALSIYDFRPFFFKVKRPSLHPSPPCEASLWLAITVCASVTANSYCGIVWALPCTHGPGPALTSHVTAFPGSSYMDIAVWGLFFLRVFLHFLLHNIISCCSVNSLQFL